MIFGSLHGNMTGNLGRKKEELGESTPNREGRMSFIFMIMAVPFLSATGIYNPQVMHHGHCIAEPGSFDALYCSATAEAAPHYRKYRAR